KPTTILTGFLGAGKTTFLNHLISNNPDKKYAIIENEYGEQSIDSDLILRAEGDIVELNNGCLCCTLNENLYEILNTLFDRKEEYDEIIIEATGVANPIGLMEPFIVHPVIKEYFPISNIVCLVDAELLEQQLEETEEAIAQVSFSDVLLINKTDLVDKQEVEKVKAILKELNPLAKVLEGNKDQFPQIEAGGNHDLYLSMLEKDEQSHSHHHEHNHAHHHGHSHSHHDGHNHSHHHGHDHAHLEKQTSFPLKKVHSHRHHEHTKEINSFILEYDRPFDYKSLYHQLNTYLIFQSTGLYRMKGIVWVQDSEEAYIIQSVGKRLDFTKYTQAHTAKANESKIVFIGKNLQQKSFERILNRCFA
ncbi:MAG: GTP-binding protein, partial [Bacteroidota bacterium]